MRTLRMGAMLLVALVGCTAPDNADVRLQIETGEPDALLRGFVEGYGGEPGTGHYEFWAVLSDETQVRFSRFAIVPATASDAVRHLTPEGAPLARDLDSGDFIGYVNTFCRLGACGGMRFVTPHDLSEITGAFITREDDGADTGVPSDDVLMRGPIQPYARGTLRGRMADPTGAPRTPLGTVTVIPLEDDASL